MLCSKVPFKTTLPGPECNPELKTLPETFMVLLLSFIVARTNLKLLVTFITGCEPAKFKTVPAGLSIVSWYNDNGAARFTVNV